MRIAIAHVTQATARSLGSALEREGHEVSWIAQSGSETLRQALDRTPELLLLDVCLTQPNAVDITRKLMAQSPCAILLLGDRPQQHLSLIYEAMGHGAIDVILGPVLDAAGNVPDSGPFRSKLRTVLKLVGQPARGPTVAPPRPSVIRQRIVAIGASTGGPQALFQILASLSQLSAPIVIAQHVDSEFMAGLASWLQQGTTLRVELAVAGCTPKSGTALLAATNDHLVMTAAGSFTYTADPKEIPYRPSVDALFMSLAKHWPTPSVAVLLTGMGRDGARGLQQLRQANWRTIAQDESTSVVFGMPKAAIELGAAEQVLGLPRIADAISRACV